MVTPTRRRGPVAAAPPDDVGQMHRRSPRWLVHVSVVMPAAGMGTQAVRLDLPGDLAWYELDRPELLALKDQLLAEVGATPRCARRPVEVDLTGDLTGLLTGAGFDPVRPTVWVIDGLISYLDVPQSFLIHATR